MTPLRLLLGVSIFAHMTFKISLQSRGEYSVIKLDARLTYYLDKWSFLQPLRAGMVQGRVGCAVDLR